MLDALLILAMAQCAAIDRPDERAYCRALEAGNPARCVEISDYALRQRCRVDLGGNTAACYTISDRNEREMCLARERPSGP